MKATDQGTRRDRYHVIPRTLIFLTSVNTETGAEEVLLLKGAPTKRLWANKYNGLGGHVEANEDVYSAALREVNEETGLTVTGLVLRGVINIDTGSDENDRRPGVMMFVFVGQTEERTFHTTSEGELAWIPVAQSKEYPLVDDLYALIPRALTRPTIFYGRYWPDEKGNLQYLFD